MKRLVTLATLIATLGAQGAVYACGRDQDGDRLLREQINQLETRIVPARSRLLARTGPQRQGETASAEWEFETPGEAGEFKRWVSGQLERDFRVQTAIPSRLVFSRYVGGDEETLIIWAVQSIGQVHVTATLVLYPD